MRNRLLIFFSKNQGKTEKYERIKWHGKMNFDGMMSWNIIEVSKFRSKKELFDKPINRGFATLEHSKRFMYEIYYDTFQQFFDPNLEGNLQLLYIDCDSYVLSIRTKELITDLGRLPEKEGTFDISNLDEMHPLYNPKKVNGKFNFQTSDAVFISEIVASIMKA